MMKLENFDRWKANGIGLDLNRQYPAGWRELSKQPDFPYYQFYRGKKPLEAKEVKALTRFIRKIEPEIAVAYHSAGREIFWNYQNGKHLKRDKRIAKKISKLTAMSWENHLNRLLAEVLPTGLLQSIIVQP